MSWGPERPGRLATGVEMIKPVFSRFNTRPRKG